MTRMLDFPDSGGEPERDERLGELLRDAVGESPMRDVDWTALAARVGSAVRAHHATPWWGHVSRWQQRALPLALAAGLVGALAIWQSSAEAREPVLVPGTGDLVTAVVSGAPADEAAMFYAGALATTVEQAATGMPE